MNSTIYMIIGVLLMSITTYLLRAIPFLFIKKKIKSTFIKSVLYYLPYSVLSAMTFPAIFFATENIYLAIIGASVALISALFKRSLITVALLCSVAILISQFII